jgi:hypothetical protein
MNMNTPKSREEHENKIAHKHSFIEYKKNMRKFIMTSRFNNITWNENSQYRNQDKTSNIGCIYCAPTPIGKHIPVDSILFVLEMNNDQNKIMGIGLVKNHYITGKHRVYGNGNYNRYIYVGKYRIDRKDMSVEEDKIMQAFDILCFTGNSHMKRGQGLKSFPAETLYKIHSVIDLIEFISEMFKKRINESKKEALTNKSK